MALNRSNSGTIVSQTPIDALRWILVAALTFCSLVCADHLTAQEAALSGVVKSKEAETRDAIDQEFASLKKELEKGNDAIALQLIDEQLENTAAENHQRLLSTKLDILLRTKGDGEAAATFLQKVVQPYADMPQLLNGLAWRIVEFEQAGNDIPRNLLAAAIEAAEQGVKSSGEDPMIVDTQANLIAISGDLERAILVQRRAVDGCKDPKVKWQLDDNLWAFRDKLNLSTSAREELERASELNAEAEGLHQRSDYANAERLFTQVLQTKKRILGEEHPHTVTSINQLGLVHLSAGNFAQAEQLFQKALLIRKESLGKQHPDYALSLGCLSLCRKETGDLPKAESLLREGIQITKEVYGDKHPNYANDLDALGLMHRHRGSYSEAERLHLKALNIWKQLGTERPQNYANCLQNIGTLYHLMGDCIRAEPLLLQALKIKQEVLGEKDPEYGKNLAALGFLYSSMGDCDQAEPLLQKALGIIEESLGKTHREYAVNLNNLASLYELKGDYGHAELLYHQVIQLYSDQRRESHPDYAIGISNLASLYISMGDYVQAESLLQQALQIKSAALGTEHPSYAISLSSLGSLYVSKGEYENAKSLYRESLKIKGATLSARHPSYAITLSKLASLHALEADYGIAEQLHLNSLKIIRESLGNEHSSYAAGLNELAVLYRQRADYRRAEQMHKKAIEITQKTLGEKHRSHVDGLNYLGIVYRQTGEYLLAEKAYLQALEILKDQGDGHPARVDLLNNLGLVYKSMGFFARAEPLYLQALDITKKAVGEENVNYATVLNNLASLYDSMGDYIRAENSYLQAKSIRKQILGEEHIDYATSLSNLGLLYLTKGDYDDALKLLQRGTRISKEVLGERHPDYANSLVNLASLYHVLGDYSTAESCLLQALQIVIESFGDAHPDIAKINNNLGYLYEDMGVYVEAEARFRWALRIESETIGKSHPAYAKVMDNLGRLYSVMGEYSQAEPLLKESLRIREAVLGSKHLDYAYSLGNLATLHYEMGDFDRSQALLEEGLRIKEELLGTKHKDYATSLINLAVLHSSMSDYAAALPLYEQALKIHKQVLGEQHPDYAASLSNLAVLHYSMGNYAAALPVLAQALKIRTQVLGEQHPDYAASLSNLAVLHYSTGDYAAALPVLEQTLNIRKQVLGEQHPDYATSLRNLAVLHSSMGDYAAALPLYQQAVEIVLDHLTKTSTVQSERQQKTLLAERRNYLDFALSDFSRIAGQTDSSLEVTWQWKGSVTLRQQAYRRVADEPALKPVFQELRSVSSRLSAMSGRVPLPPPLAATETEKSNYQVRKENWANQFKELSTQREKLEADIASKNEIFRQATEPLTVAEVQELLPNESVFVDFLEYRHSEPDSNKPGKFVNEKRYLAFFVPKQGEVSLLQLGSAQTIKEQISQFRLQFRERVTNKDRANAQAAGQGLRQLLWEPIAAKLAGVDTIIVSPDTEISALPFAALPGSKPDSYLIEDYKFLMLPLAAMLRDLSASNEDRPTPDKGLLVLGDVDYKLAEPARNTVAKRNKAWGQNRAAARRDDVSFDELEYAQAELSSISDIFKQVFDDPQGQGLSVLRQQEATEEAFMEQAPKHFNLHIITHGFFAAPEYVDVPSDRLAGEQFSAPANRAGFASRAELGRTVQVQRDLPNLLTGLAMAGANEPPSNENPEDDGILTAAEIESMNLNSVDLVVLSACETALGKSVQGEGLTGLQRAFHLAGARSCVASLWKVPDQATNELMRRFYKYYWDEGLSKIDALRQAQLELLNDRDLVRGLGANQQQNVDPSKPSAPESTTSRTHPLYWAAFQLSGDWQ